MNDTKPHHSRTRAIVVVVGGGRDFIIVYFWPPPSPFVSAAEGKPSLAGPASFNSAHSFQKTGALERRDRARGDNLVRARAATCSPVRTHLSRTPFLI